VGRLARKKSLGGEKGPQQHQPLIRLLPGAGEEEPGVIRCNQPETAFRGRGGWDGMKKRGPTFRAVTFILSSGCSGGAESRGGEYGVEGVFTSQENEPEERRERTVNVVQISEIV